MLNDNKFHEWQQNLKLSEQAKKLITDIRGSSPARSVGNKTRRNVKGKFPSRKMGWTVQFESHTCELPGIYMMEYVDHDVLEMYDQPCPIRLNYKGGEKEKVVGINHIPDFFVLRKDCAGFEEWKTEENLIKLSIKQPNRYVRTEDGWRCPPGEEYAATFGLYYRIRSSAEINPVLYRNLEYLENYLRTDTIDVVDDVAADLIINTVRENPGISTRQLLDVPGIDADSINIMIVSKRIYVDIYNVILGEHDFAFVYSDEKIAEAYSIKRQSQVKQEKFSDIIRMEAGSAFNWDGKQWIISNPGNTELSITPLNGGKTISLKSEDFQYLLNNGKIQGLVAEKNDDLDKQISNILLEASEKDLEVANQRHKAILGQLDIRGELLISITTRNLSNWKKSYKNAEVLYGFGYLGLLPKRKNQGNRTNHKVTEDNYKLINTFITEFYETTTWPYKIRAYEAYEKDCLKKGWPPVNLKTFNKYVKLRPKFEQTTKTEGHRAAYEYEQWYIEWDSPRHGDKVFQLAHVDHTQLDIELVDEYGNLGRPWMSIMVDAFSRRILAAILSFDEPSYRSVMMLMRECVRRHGTLPRTIVVDNGKEFESVYFETLMAMFEVKIKSRPPSKARFGTICERIFGTTNTKFIHNLMGNTKIMRTKTRMVTKSVNPKNLAVWTLDELYPALLEFVYVIYDQHNHSSLGASPKMVFEQSIFLSGRPRSVAYNETFLILTMPTVPREVIVHPGSGVRVLRFDYWSDSFNDPRVQGKKVKVKYDPMDISKAYAYVNKGWVACTVSHYVALRGKTEREIEIATKEMRKAKGRKSDQITGKQLVDFMLENQDNEKIKIQQRKDAELKTALTVINGGKTKANNPTVKPHQESPQKVANGKETKIKKPDSEPSVTFNWADL